MRTAQKLENPDSRCTLVAGAPPVLLLVLERSSSEGQAYRRCGTGSQIGLLISLLCSSGGRRVQRRLVGDLGPNVVEREAHLVYMVGKIMAVDGDEKSAAVGRERFRGNR